MLKVSRFGLGFRFLVFEFLKLFEHLLVLVEELVNKIDGIGVEMTVMKFICFELLLDLFVLGMILIVHLNLNC